MKIIEFEKYANKAANLIECNIQTRRRIKEDILDILYTHYEETANEDPEDIMGSPYDVAKEFSENLNKYSVYTYEYKSKKTFWGLPLVHITTSQNATAKGIIAIGPKAVGVISLGGLSAGIFSVGGLSVGLLALGGLAIGGGAIGGAAVAYDFAIGGIAIAKSLSVGGIAIAKKVSIGGLSIAKLMGYSQSYQIPDSLDEGSAFAFSYPLYKQSLWLKYKEIYGSLGPIKDLIIRLCTK